MENRKDIRKEVEDTFNSLDGMQKAQAPHFFFTRLMARVKRDEITMWERTIAFITRPATAFGGVALVIVLNVAAFLSQPGNGNDNATQAEITTTEEYMLATASDYDDDNNDTYAGADKK
jgi:hypothetical protein